MQKVLILSLLLALSLCTEYSRLTQREKYQQFMLFQVKHGRFYSTSEEKLYRFRVFSENLNLIEEVQKNDPSAIYGINEFADLTQDEFRALYHGYRPEMRNSNNQGSTEQQIIMQDAPDTFDWSEQGAVTDIKNQGQCGSCWAFSTTGSIEGQYYLKHKQLVAFSEQQLVDCDKVDQGCNGGLMDQAFTYLQSTKLMTEQDYAYKGVDGKCAYDASKGVAQVTGHVDVSQDEKVIAQTLATVGPLSVALNALNLQFYFGGVSDPWLCNPKNLDHGVLLVGYGNNGTKDFWKVKNSWSRSWGEKGYFRLVRGKGKCGINTAVSYPQVQ